jgi:hypothetical protein
MGAAATAVVLSGALLTGDAEGEVEEAAAAAAAASEAATAAAAVEDEAVNPMGDGRIEEVVRTERGRGATAAMGAEMETGTL